MTADVVLGAGTPFDELGDVETLKPLTVADGLRSGYDPVKALSIKLSLIT